jgi:peptide/nickel transport system permease protein
LLTYVARRLAGAILLVFGLLTLTFFIIHLSPGDPAARFYSPETSPDAVRVIRAKWGLDDPVHVQYLHWLGNAVRGDFGTSFTNYRPVIEVIADAAPNTLVLSSLALLLDLILGVLIGTVSAVRQYSRLDHSLTVGALFVYSIPGFWLALMLIMIFSLELHWLPSSLMHSVGYEAMSFPARTWDFIKHLILPVFVLGIAAAASTARYTRASLLDVIRQDFVRTARAKGLPERLVIGKHAMRNALIPVVTLMGLSLPFLFSGAVIVETVFAWPGMGRVIVGSIFERNYPVILAANLVVAVLVILGNLVADVLYGILDPRIRYEGGGRRT